MVLARTRKKISHSLKEQIFALCNLQAMLDENDKRALERSMGFTGQWDEHRRFQIQFLHQTGLLPGHSLMEIGCGPLTGGVPIICYLDAGNYTGIDVRPSVLDMSWKEVGKAGLSAKNPRLICSTSFGDNVLNEVRFDFVLSFSVLFHLSDELLHQCFEVVSRRVKRGGAFYANVNTETACDRWLEYPFLRRTVAEYQAAAGRVGLRTTVLGTLADLGFKLPGEERLNKMLRFDLA